MALYRYIFIAAGTVVWAYVMLKLILSKSEKSSGKTSESKETDKVDEQQPGESSVESGKITDQQDKCNVKTLKLRVKPVGGQPDDNKRAMKFPRLKPNYFLAFPVNNITIHKKVKALQEKLIKENPLLHPAIVNVSTFHITLAVTHLASEKDINIVKNKLDEWAVNNLKKYFEKPCVLNFTGVKTFNDVVAYVGLEHCENYNKITDLSKNLNDMLSSAGYTTDTHNFTPHLTFLKLTKDFKMLKLKKTFKKNFKSLIECKEHFGQQEVRHLQLLSMDKPKDKFGYYDCAHQIQVSDTDEPKADHSECCTPIEKPKKSSK